MVDAYDWSRQIVDDLASGGLGECDRHGTHASWASETCPECDGEGCEWCAYGGHIAVCQRCGWCPQCGYPAEDGYCTVCGFPV